jgi:hypothetical protein
LTSNTVIISQVLQQNWTLTAPAVIDILWPTTRVETLAFPANGKNCIVSCYNPTGAQQNEPLTREAWKQSERITIDIIVKVTNTLSAATEIRENIRNEIYRIIHNQELQISNITDTYIDRETTRIESQELVRSTLQIICNSFHLKG